MKIFPLKIFRISGHSMEPTLPVGSYVLIFAWTKHYKVGDIIAFKYENQIVIKRLHSINNHNYVVLGDNASDSLDSRQFGQIPFNNIIGKIIWY